mmetsp:Transcript_1631/g.1803  ORF Transcript_1631/g.1803 Transcript_1631/m.1803 type:complete len:243 (+) Transcript_1631:96-824(+)
MRMSAFQGSEIREEDYNLKDNEEIWDDKDRLTIKNPQIEFGENPKYFDRIKEDRNTERILDKEIVIIKRIWRIQKTIVCKINNTSIYNEEDDYILISSKWINSWIKYLKAPDIAGKPPLRNFSNKELHNKSKVEHRKDFYIIPSGELWVNFNKHFCCQTVPYYKIHSVPDETVFQSSHPSEAYKNLPRDSENNQYLPNLPRSSEQEIENALNSNWQGYVKEHHTHFMDQGQSSRSEIIDLAD